MPSRPEFTSPTERRPADRVHLRAWAWRVLAVERIESWGPCALELLMRLDQAEAGDAAADRQVRRWLAGLVIEAGGGRWNLHRPVEASRR